MAITTKRDGLFTKNWHFMDGKMSGTKSYSGEVLADVTKCPSIAHAEFWQNYMMASALNPDVSNLIDFVNNAPESYAVKRTVLETITGQDEILKGVMVQEVSNAATSNDATKLDAKNLEAIMIPELIEFPAELAEDERIQDTAGYQMLEEVVEKSVVAIDSYYRSQIVAAMNEGRSDVAIATIIKTAKDNTELFELQLRLATTNLMYKKIMSLSEQMKKTGHDTAKAIAIKNRLKKEATENRELAEKYMKAIKDFKTAHKKHVSAYTEAVLGEVGDLSETVVDKKGKLGRAEEKNATAHKDLEDAELWHEAVNTILADVKIEVAQELYSASVGAKISETEIAAFLKDGTLPESFKKFVKDIPRSERKKIYHDFIKKAKAEKARLAAEKQPGEDA